MAATGRPAAARGRAAARQWRNQRGGSTRRGGRGSDTGGAPAARCGAGRGVSEGPLQRSALRRRQIRESPFAGRSTLLCGPEQAARLIPCCSRAAGWREFSRCLSSTRLRHAAHRHAFALFSRSFQGLCGPHSGARASPLLRLSRQQALRGSCPPNACVALVGVGWLLVQALPLLEARFHFLRGKY